MGSSHRVLVLGLAALLGSAWLWTGTSPDETEPAQLPAGSNAERQPARTLAPASAPEFQPWAGPHAAASASSPTQSETVIAGDESSDTLRLRLDAQRRLVIDEATRLDVEKLFALNEPVARIRKQRILEASLPPEAAREFAALMSRYDHYQEAQFQQLPPGQAVNSRADAMAQFDRLRALRVLYFGAPLAEQLYGAEEAQQLKLLAQFPIDPRP